MISPLPAHHREGGCVISVVLQSHTLSYFEAESGDGDEGVVLPGAGEASDEPDAEVDDVAF